MAASEFTRRLLVSIVAVPLVLGAAVLGAWPLALLLGIVGGIAAWEFCRMAREGGYEPFTEFAIICAALLPLGVRASVGAPAPGGSESLSSIARLLDAAFVGHGGSAVALLVLVVFAGAIFYRGPARHPIGAAASTLFGILYTGGLISFAYALRYFDYAVGVAAGTAVLLFPLVLTWTTDTGAYLVGRAVGRHRLIPAVSPGKTIEGAVAGLLLAVVVAWIYERWALVPEASLAFAPGAVLLFGAVVSAAVQLGDLAESMIKREVGRKDSSRIIPGHGGVLDRIDGMLFALPAAWWLFHLLPVTPVLR